MKTQEELALIPLNKIIRNNDETGHKIKSFFKFSYRVERGFKMLKNLRAFEITMLHVTQTKGDRVKIKDLRHKKRKIINWSYEFNSCKDEAEVYLKSLGIPCLYGCETEKGFIILTDNFDIMIK